MLAGRKLLLADDSITIQKIVALTFADEGIEVIATSNGAEAIEKLEEISPDIVLADVFMPYLTGYQVCEHIKQTPDLRHIPVMLLVGSFEPFDEAEARRVGADDTLTKPFQSIRTLVDKVGALLGRKTVADQVEESAIRPDTTPESPASSATKREGPPVERLPSSRELEANTMDLPPPEVVPPPEEPMTPAELEITTADTLRLSPEIRQHIEQFSSDEVRRVETVREAETMHTNFDIDRPEPAEGFGEALLDLGQLEPVEYLADDDSILDIDFDSAAPDVISSPAIKVHSAVAAETAVDIPAFAPGFVEDSLVSLASGEGTVAKGFQTEARESFGDVYAHEETERMAQPEMVTEQSRPAALLISEDAVGSTPSGRITLEQLSPEVLDAIARRAVEQLSEKVVQEIAWEVVPQLAELMIKRRLEEHEAQNK